MAKIYLQKFLLFSIGVFSALVSFAQDVQYSQYYAAPLFLNPAMTGASELTRVGVNYRNQWPGLDHSFNSYSAYIDHYAFDYNSGIGLIFNGNKESLAQLSTNEVGLLYSYRLKVGSDKFLRVGGQVSYIARDAYFGNLVFGSMIDISTGGTNFLTDELQNVPIDARHRFLDYSFGTLFTTNKIWLGASAHHVTEPNVSFVEDATSRLPLKFSAQGGIRFDLGYGGINNTFSNVYQERSISFAFNYKQQAPFNQLDIGTQLYLEPLVLGLWYRGLPSKYNMPNNESIIGLLGVALESGMDIGYSFDFTTSKLGLRNSGGAHEISIRYTFLWGDQRSRNQRSRVNPCFFY